MFSLNLRYETKRNNWQIVKELSKELLILRIRGKIGSQREGLAW